MPRPPVVLLIAAALLLGARPAGAASAAGTTTTVTLAVATSLVPVLEPLFTRYQASHAVRVQMVPGATGKLAAQITSGAPYDALIAADAETPALLERNGLAVAGSSHTIAFGRLALWSAHADALGAAPVDTLRAARFQWLAIAEPGTAPYGRAAVECLRALGLEQALSAKLVRGESAAQALQFVESGAADLGFVPLSLLRAPALAGRGSTWIVPDSLHAPIAHVTCLLAHGAKSQATRDVLTYLQGPAVRARLDSLGFRLP